jgi:hypothetical protein
MTCADFINHSNEAGFGDIALANEVLQDASTKLEFGQEIRQFPGANVASQLSPAWWRSPAGAGRLPYRSQA